MAQAVLGALGGGGTAATTGTAAGTGAGTVGTGGLGSLASGGVGFGAGSGGSLASGGLGSLASGGVGFGTGAGGGLSSVGGLGGLGGAGAGSGILSALGQYGTEAIKGVGSYVKEHPFKTAGGAAQAYKQLREEFKMPNVGAPAGRQPMAPLQAPSFGGGRVPTPAERLAMMNQGGR